MSLSTKPPLDTTRFIARHVSGLRRSGIRDFFELVAKTDGVISLGIGEPDFDTPQPIRDAVKTAMDTGKTHYTSNLGQPDLRKEISRYVQGYFNVGYSWEDEILVTVGVSEALDLAMRALLNPGDKVLYHQPCYVSYAPTVELVHGVGVPVATSAAQQFSLDEPALRAAWQPGCKLLLLNLPCNPTGGVCSREQLEALPCGKTLTYPFGSRRVRERTHEAQRGTCWRRLSEDARIRHDAYEAAEDRVGEPDAIGAQSGVQPVAVEDVIGGIRAECVDEHIHVGDEQRHAILSSASHTASRSSRSTSAPGRVRSARWRPCAAATPWSRAPRATS